MKYVNQAKSVCAHGKTLQDWEDVCNGHDTYDKADACQEMMKTAIEGKPPPEEYGAGPGILALMSAFGALSEVTGVKTEWRIVKRTDEVVDEKV